MSKVKRMVMVCDVCQGVDGSEYPVGVTFASGNWNDDNGGGPLPRSLFVCHSCRKTTVAELVRITRTMLEENK